MVKAAATVVEKVGNLFALMYRFEVTGLHPAGAKASTESDESRDLAATLLVAARVSGCGCRRRGSAGGNGSSGGEWERFGRMKSSEITARFGAAVGELRCARLARGAPEMGRREDASGCEYAISG